MVRTRHDESHSIKYTLEEDLGMTAEDFIEIAGELNLTLENFAIPAGN